jgi:hypothetical protein
MLRVATGILVQARPVALVGKRKSTLATALAAIASTCAQDYALGEREVQVISRVYVCAEDEVENHLPPAISAAVFSEEVFTRFKARVAVSVL